MKLKTLFLAGLVAGVALVSRAYENPFIYADVPDLDIVRVDDTYYMVSTTMHYSPGCTIMKSKDLVNWSVLGYAHDQLEETDDFALKNGRDVYANGSWAANIRYDKYEKRFYLLVSSNTNMRSYLFSTDDIESGKWHRNSFEMCYDPGLLFDDTGSECKKYIIHPDFSLVKHEVFLREVTTDGKGNATVSKPRVIIPHGNIENPACGLRAEGAHGYRIGEWYYLFMIQGCGAQRQEIVWRTKDLANGPWEVKRVFAGDLVEADGQTKYIPFTGIAQGGIVDTPDGRWYSFLFQDYGSVGRMPCLAPMTWDENAWPVIGNNGESMYRFYDDPIKGQPKTFVVVNDEFDNGTKRYYPSDKYASDDVTAGRSLADIRARAEAGTLTNDWLEENEYAFNGSILKREWQWNHNPNNNLWSLTERPGYLRLKTGVVYPNIRRARNTISQRTYGPTSHAETVLETREMRDGDCAGLAAYQNQYGWVGVKKENGKTFLVMQKAMERGDANGRECARVPLTASRVHLRVDCDFRQKTDKANFFYSLDGKNWKRIGSTLQMNYDWPDFVGQRFALFAYATEKAGGAADFDFFHVGDDLLEDVPSATGSKAPRAIGLDASGSRTLKLALNKSVTPFIGAYYPNGAIVDVSEGMKVTVDDASVVAIDKGVFKGLRVGETTVHATVVAGAGREGKIDFTVRVGLLPLEAYKANVFGEGQFDLATRTITTTPWGFGGWEYEANVDLTAYEAIEVEFESLPACEVQILCFDHESYWSRPAKFVLSKDLKQRIPVSAFKKDVRPDDKSADESKFDPTAIRKIGFWTNDKGVIKLKSIKAIAK